ncbi:MAG: polysaccharide deacetylase family protein [Pseudomonadota bacterium]
MRKVLSLALCFGLCGFLAMLAFDYSKARDQQLFGELVHRVETDQPLIALTFDDGPTPRAVSILATLLEMDVTATFFLTGREITANPEDAAMIVAQGHEIGNHSWDHPRMVLIWPSAVRDQLSRTDQAIRATGYDGPIHVRPPFGRKFIVLPRVLSQQDRTTIMWSIEPETTLGFDAAPEALAQHVIETAQPGDIVLLHGMYSTNDSTRAALPLIINGLRARGFSFVTVSDLIAAGG